MVQVVDRGFMVSLLQVGFSPDEDSVAAYSKFVTGNWQWAGVTGELMLSNCGTGEDSWGSPGQQGDRTNQS